MDIEQDKTFLKQTRNKRFIQFMNLIYEAVNVHNITFDKIRDAVKTYRVDYLQKKVYNAVPSCIYNGIIGTDEYFEHVTTKLNITHTLNKQPIYKEQLTDSFLSDGFKLFHYLARCRDTEKDNVNTFQYNIDVFNTDSPATVLEAAIHIRNTDARRVVSSDVWGTRSAEKLIEKLQSVLPLELDKFDILSSPTSAILPRLGSIRDDGLRNLLEHCIHNSKRQELEELLDYLGNNKYLTNIKDLYK